MVNPNSSGFESLHVNFGMPVAASPSNHTEAGLRALEGGEDGPLRFGAENIAPFGPHGAEEGSLLLGGWVRGMVGCVGFAHLSNSSWLNSTHLEK